MAGGVADVLEVVVLAAGTHTLLAACGAGVGPLVKAEKNVFELVHPGVGEQQRRVAVRHQRARGHHGVALAGEEVEELLADLAAVHLNFRKGPHKPP